MTTNILERLSRVINDTPSRYDTSGELNIRRIAEAADQAIEKKYPYLSQSLRYPLRSQHINIITALQKKLINSKEKKLLDEDGKEEKKIMDDYYNEATKFGREQMRNYTLLNRTIDHNIPQIVKNSLFSLGLYKDIPIINGVLMAPFNSETVGYKTKIQKVWKNGKLNRLNLFKLKGLISSKNEKLSKLMEDKKINDLPEYSILRTYISNPAKLGSVISRISKKQSQFKDPKKMASLLFKEVKENIGKTKNNNYSSKYLSYRDNENMDFLSRINPRDISLVKSNKNKVKSYIDNLLNNERLTGDSRLRAYSHFAPGYVSLFKKEPSNINVRDIFD